LYTGVKLDAKQLNIFGIGRKTTQHFWIQSLIKKKKIKFSSTHFHLKVTVTETKIDSSHESGKNFITWAWPTSSTII
jgi:hypothetical protein